MNCDGFINQADADEIIRELNAGVEQWDFGDAPTAEQSGFASSYPVTLAQDGARHTVGSVSLGEITRSATDGVPSVNALGDNDDDGVQSAASLVAVEDSATIGSFAVFASGEGKLDA